MGIELLTVREKPRILLVETGSPRSSNGRTEDSESSNHGSNPCLGTKKIQPNGWIFLS